MTAVALPAAQADGAAYRGVAPLLLLGAGLLAYVNALDADFQFDDYAVIVDNADVHSLRAWADALPGIRPLLKLACALNWRLAPQAAAFHAVNVAVHLLNALLLWRLALDWLARLRPARDPRFAAFATALLFAVHPATTEAVTYASGRSISLAASFMLAALLADAHARRVGDPPRLRWLGAALFALALGVRETALIVPLAVLLPTWCRRERLDLRRLRAHAVVLGVAALAALATPGYRRFFTASLDARGPLEQGLGQLAAQAYLASGPLLGRVGAIDPDLTAWLAPLPLLATALLLGGVLVLIGWTRGRMPWLAFALVWYLLQLAPSNSLLPRLDLVNDRHLYLALAGPVLIVAVALDGLRNRVAARCALCALALALGLATVRRNADYASETRLWQANLAAGSTGARAWTNLGYAQRRAGDVDAAVRAYRCALAADPGYAQAVLNLAVISRDDADLTPLPDARCRALIDGFRRTL